MSSKRTVVKERTVIADERCIHRGCKNKAETRGLCRRRHYNRMWFQVEIEGKYTWEEAEAAGLCLPKKRGVGEYYLREIERYRASKLA